MRRLPLKSALCLALLGLAPGAAAATFVFETNLSGANENPPVVSPGTGFVRLTVDNVASTMRVQTTFADLLGETTAAHIHCCAAPPTNAAPATTVPSFPGFPTGVTFGTYDQTFDMLAAASYNPGFVTANGNTPAGAFTAFLNGLNAGQAYFNIHTGRFPGGEIRGQLTAVPELTTWAMMIVGFGAVAATMRGVRRKRSISRNPGASIKFVRDAAY